MIVAKVRLGVLEYLQIVAGKRVLFSVEAPLKEVKEMGYGRTKA